MGLKTFLNSITMKGKSSFKIFNITRTLISIWTMSFIAFASTLELDSLIKLSLK